MKLSRTFAAALLAAVMVPTAVSAQGTVRGAAEGADQGGRAAGPLGAIVGGTVGAATGTVGGILGVDERPRFREYVVRERRPSYHYEGDVQGGRRSSVPRGVKYYAVPREYRSAARYRYAYVNERPVLVEPRSRRIVEIIE